MLNEQGELSVKDLSKIFKVSEVSIRNDLTYLEKKGLLIRNHGGAIKNQSINFDLNLTERIKRFHKEKNKIGKRASKLVKDNYKIIMDSGSTTIEVAKHLVDFNNLKIITNSLPIAYILGENKNIEVIIPGGVLRGKMKSLKGSLVEKNISMFNCDIAFIGVDSILPEKGIFTHSIEEASLSKHMIDIANKVVVVADSSKFNKNEFAKIENFSSIDVLITDSGVTDEDRQKIETQGTKIIVV